MNLLHFISDFTRKKDFREKFRTLANTSERVEILRDRYGLDDRQIGIVLREDQTAAMQEVAREVADFDFEAQAARDSASDDDTTGGGDGGVQWPGPMAVAVESVTPSRGKAGDELELTIVGWHLAQDVTITFAKEGAQATARVNSVHTDFQTGRSWVRVEVTLASKGPWDITAQNNAGAHRRASTLASGFRAT